MIRYLQDITATLLIGSMLHCTIQFLMYRPYIEAFKKLAEEFAK